MAHSYTCTLHSACAKYKDYIFGKVWNFGSAGKLILEAVPNDISVVISPDVLKKI